MAAHQQASPTAGLHHHGPPPGHPQQNGALMHVQAPQQKSTAQILSAANEQVWLQLGAFVLSSCQCSRISLVGNTL